MIRISKKYIWFDLGYTLVYLNREKKYQELLEDFGVKLPIANIALAYHLADKYFMREHPGLLGKKRELFMLEYHRTLHNYLGIDPIEEMLHPDGKAETGKPDWRAFPDTLVTLQKLKEAGFQVGLISNWDNTAREVLKQTGIVHYLDNTVISSEIGIEKPDEQIFLHAFQEAGVSPEECLYVGDNYYDDVVGSKKVGMDSILINPYGNKGIEELSNVETISNVKDLYEKVTVLA
ncbi:HAD family hydrolase [Gracilibacillus xinjiangensis]|uniref:HAD family hydrolase n=1 Tax=Gracilibacillus xinjiangensis TaxID=1193282 RepID=A0ABV8WRT8_9BACI